MRLWLGFLVFISLLACGKASHREQARSYEAPDAIGESFSIEKFSESTSRLTPSDDKAAISIKKDSLEKEFLLQTQMIAQNNYPGFTGMRSRIVAFRKRADQLYLLEVSKGHVVDDSKTAILLAAFDIKKETVKEITFDWNKGMSRLFLASDWYASDFEYTAYPENFNHLPIKLSYIEDAALIDDIHLEIRQIAQAEAGGSDGLSSMPIEIKYYLSPYKPDPDYQPKKTTDFQHLGFFEAMPRYPGNGGMEVTYASRFAPHKTIEFAVSANTPPEFKDAVRAGILYWESILGKGKITAVDAAPEAAAPSFKQNIVQWVNWDAGGFAYADAQMDPRTGEILHAQVYMTSAFAFIAEYRARALLRTLKKQASTKRRSFGIKGLTARPLCSRSQWQSMAAELEATLASNPSKETLTRLAQDFVRVVVAHEIGHTLGLRHNFSGSLATNFSLSDRPEIFNTYLKDAAVDSGLVASSSVMDYLAFAEDVIVGHQLKDPEHALSYDRAAINHLYKGETLSLVQPPLFCTDSHVDPFSDCERGDIGASVPEAAQFNFQDKLDNQPYALLEQFIAGKTPVFGAKERSVEQVSLNAKRAAASIIGSHAELLKLLGEGGKLLRIHRQYAYVDDSNAEEVSEAQSTYLADEIERLGGLSKVLQELEPDFAEKQYENFVKVIDDGNFTTGVGGNGEEFNFNSNEISLIKSKAKKFYFQLYEQLTEFSVATLALPKKLADHPLGDDFAKFLAQRTRSVVFAKSGKSETISLTVPDKTEKGDKKVTERKTRVITVKLPTFKFDFKVRLKAAGLLKKSRSENIVWAHAERTALVKSWKEELKGILQGSDIGDLKTDELTAKAAKWVLENRKILAELGK